MSKINSFLLKQVKFLGGLRCEHVGVLENVDVLGLLALSHLYNKLSAHISPSSIIK